MVAIFMMSAKSASLGLLKIKVIWSKGHDVIISVHDVTNKILSNYSNYIVDAVISPNFGNSRIAMREVIITSIFIKIWPEKPFFWGVMLVQVQLFGSGTRYGFEILHQLAKGSKLKVRKF